MLALITATIVLSNLTFDLEYMEEFSRRSYGWPLVWRRCILVLHGGWRTVGWYNSPPRLAGNAAMWVLMAAGPTALCEWLLRRYRPRLRWSLRTMLAAVALLAALCGWFANARDRANVQDPIIAAMPMHPTAELKVERWGPKWLDLFGVDRFCRRIVSVHTTQGFAGSHEEADELLKFKRLSKLPELQELLIVVDRLAPAVPNALAEMKRLKRLSISHQHGPTKDDEAISRECLAAIGKLTHLESLDLSIMGVSPESLTRLSGLKNLKSLTLWNLRTFDDDTCLSADECLTAIRDFTQLEHLALGMKFKTESLALLSGLTKLKSLGVDDFTPLDEETSGACLLCGLPVLPRLESLSIDSAQIRDHDLRRLAVLPRLKSLDIQRTHVTSAGLAELASLESLEELAISSETATAAGLETLRRVEHLKWLHIGRPSISNAARAQLAQVELDGNGTADVPTAEREIFVRAITALRQANPGIVIDNGSIRVSEQPTMYLDLLVNYDTKPVRDFTWLPTSGAPWLTAVEMADFVESGGMASFDMAEWRDKEGRKLESPPGWGGLTAF